MDIVSSMTKYFRASLADESLLGVVADASDSGQATAPSLGIQDGLVPLAVASKLFSEWKKRNKSDQDPDKIEVMVSPFSFHLESSHGHCPETIPKELLPLWLLALLSPTGKLEPMKRGPSPWLHREYLNPAGSEVVISSVTDFDAYVSKHWDESAHAGGWSAYFGFGREMLEKLTPLMASETVSLGRADYVRQDKGLVVLGGVNSHIRAGLQLLYERISIAITKNKTSIDPYASLLKLYASLLKGVPKSERIHLSLDDELVMAARHLGQMSREYPLGATQRQAIHHYLNDSFGDVTTINGPPGTGKTTLLKSVVASLLVQRAYSGAEAGPLIGATSANNQAVTNIIKDFGKILPEKGGSIFEQRWLPGPLRSLGLYAVSSSNEPSEYHSLTINRDGQHEGFYQELETPEYIKKGELLFLERFREAFPGTACPDMDTARKCIRQCIREKVNALQDALGSLKEHRKHQDRLPTLRKDLDVAKVEARIPREAFAVADQHKTLAEAEENRLAVVLTDFERHCANESVWLGIFGFIPAVREKRLAAVRADFQHRLAPALLLGARTPKEIRDQLADACARAMADVQAASSTLQEAAGKLQLAKARIEALSSKLLETEARISAFLEEHELENLEEQGCYKYLARLDTGLRYDLFTLAIHYFEALWVVKTRKAIQDSVPGGNGKDDFARLEARWRRYAMLTPCVVSTVYMLPKFFRAGRTREPLLGALDLLIIDEAGQATTPTTAGLFALAQRAIVVGDRHQIEPVWSIPENVDAGNLAVCRVLPDAQGIGIPDSAAHLCASKGSAILLAQAASRYQLPGYQEPGLHLMEHRRCQPEIIRFCKELVYPRLQVLTAPSPAPELRSLKELGIPPFGYFHVPGESETRGGSRCNLYEAENIAAWVKSNQAALQKIYPGRRIEEIVGIVTPFKAQEGAIRDYLGQNTGITIGTVHRLQGAERPIILFSLVYGSQDGNTRFIDSKVNLLNVAVSRAQHSFLLFGNMDALSIKDDKPSARLARQLLSEEDNEMRFPLTPRRNLLTKTGTRHLSTLEDHRAMLQEAFTSAQKELLIVSPFLARRALEEDNVPEMVRDAVTRGVAVEIYSDSTFHNSPGSKTKLGECVEILRQAGAQVSLVERFHNKTLIVDDFILVEGSFNWFSASRSGAHVRQEHSIRYASTEVAGIKQKAKESLAKRNAGASVDCGG